jgi:hypothetical protein
MEARWSSEKDSDLLSFVRLDGSRGAWACDDAMTDVVGTFKIIFILDLNTFLQYDILKTSDKKFHLCREGSF